MNPADRRIHKVLVKAQATEALTLTRYHLKRRCFAASADLG
jgi:hypothetical protein